MIDNSPETVILPPEAADKRSRRFNPDDEWIKKAPKALQIEAMRRWFLNRYENPAKHTPYISSEGGYQFIHGGPYDPNDEIQDRFSTVVEYSAIKELVEQLHKEVGEEWAPIEPDDLDYYTPLSLVVSHRWDPARILTDRLKQIRSILKVKIDPDGNELIHQLAHGAVITALETYLCDTISFWVSNDEKDLRDFVKSNKDFQGKTITLSTIFDRLDTLQKEVQSYLQDIVWHRLDRIKSIFEGCLEITTPDIGPLMKEVQIRHDIVHRAGRTKDGARTIVSVAQVENLIQLVENFAAAIEDGLLLRHPYSDDEVPF